jgi:3'-phosphoadenosine 5'-phosphosulfate sulfotransferase (PAPS reductase)/FAD synthetase
MMAPGRIIMIYHIGISGGKDSTALLLWAIHESGLDWSDLRITFSDTGNEHDWTYWYVRYLSRYVRRVTNGKVKIKWLTPELDFYELARKKKRFPSQVARFCTEHLKLLPTAKYINQLTETGCAVIALSGVRDSENRAVVRREFEKACGSIFNVPQWNPLFRWTLADVWAIHKRYGLARNPLYVATQTVRAPESLKGYLWIRTPIGLRPYRAAAGRVGCYPCINSRKSEIANVARNFPDRINLIRAAENNMTSDYGFNGFFHRKGVPNRFHSKIIELKPLAGKQIKAEKGTLFEGEKITVTAKPLVAVTVPTIDDVVRWALSDTDENETLNFDEESLAARMVCQRSGACE